MASGSGWNLWVWLLGVVRRYIDFLILLIPTPLVSVLFYSSIPTFCLFFKMFYNSIASYNSTDGTAHIKKYLPLKRVSYCAKRNYGIAPGPRVQQKNQC